MSYAHKQGLVYIRDVNFQDSWPPPRWEGRRWTMRTMLGAQLTSRTLLPGSRQRAGRWEDDIDLLLKRDLVHGGKSGVPGTTGGYFIAYRADTGEKLWSFPTESGVLAAASTVEIDGNQMISSPRVPALHQDWCPLWRTTRPGSYPALSVSEWFGSLDQRQRSLGCLEPIVAAVIPTSGPTVADHPELLQCHRRPGWNVRRRSARGYSLYPLKSSGGLPEITCP